MALFSRKRSLLQSQKLLRRERVWLWAKIVFALALVGGIFWGLSALSYSPKLNVQTVLVTGNKAVPTEEVLQITRTLISGRKFLIFSKANTLWYPKKQIRDTLQYSFSWIDSLSVERVNFSTIAIKIKERVPVAVWCGESADKPRSCQLMDEEGYIFADAPEFSGAAYLKLYGPLTSANDRGAQFFDHQGLLHILGFAKALPEIGFKPLTAAVIGTNSYDVVTDGGARIFAQTTDPIPDIVSNIDSLLGQKPFVESHASNFSNLMYIDTRFGNKLFYKFRE